LNPSASRFSAPRRVAQ